MKQFKKKNCLKETKLKVVFFFLSINKKIILIKLLSFVYLDTPAKKILHDIRDFFELLLFFFFNLVFKFTKLEKIRVLRFTARK